MCSNFIEFGADEGCESNGAIVYNMTPPDATVVRIEIMLFFVHQRSVDCLCREVGAVEAVVG